MMRFWFGVILLFWCGQVLAQMPVQDFEQDTSQPIDITSQTMQVKPKENRAMFMGDVQAVQGEMHLTSDNMEVFYHEAGSKKPEQNAISKIITEGNVFLVVPGKSAKAEKGAYDVDGSLITLEGNVLLEEGPSMLKGQKFTYNVATRESRMISGGQGVSSGEAKPGRVKAVFVPKRKKKSEDSPVDTFIPVPVEKPQP